MTDFNLLSKFISYNKSTIIEKGSPWAKLILVPQSDPHRERIRQNLLLDPKIIKIIHRLHDPKLGINSLFQKPADYRIYGSFYWGLRFLADIGLNGEELGIG